MGQGTGETVGHGIAGRVLRLHYERLPHGCEAMADHLYDHEVPISYDPIFREYALQLIRQGAFQLVQYCPWCGEKLPPSLREAFFDRMDELGIDGAEDEPPPEYRSDVWWWPGEDEA